MRINRARLGVDRLELADAIYKALVDGGSEGNVFEVAISGRPTEANYDGTTVDGDIDLLKVADAVIYYLSKLDSKK